jgi:hypothetical protein
VLIQTLHTLVLSILDRSREPAVADEKLFPVLVRRLARQQPALRKSLDSLRNGYAVVEACVSDLLDAGFLSPHSDAVIEQIEELGQGSHTERAIAVVRVAAAVGEALEEAIAGHRSAWVRRADELLDANPEGAVPARAIFVFGFADATGVQTDFIETLLRRCGAQIWINHRILKIPPSPTPALRFQHVSVTGYWARWAATRETPV